MKILFIDVNATFVNPTRNLLAALCAEIGEVRAFGPGFVSSDCLRQGLLQFTKTAGPFDVAIVTPHILFAGTYSNALAQSYRRNYDAWAARSDLPYLGEIATQLQRLDLPRIGATFESDLYNFSAFEIDRIEQCTDYVIGLGEDLWRPKAELPQLAEEVWAKRANDSWFEFVARHRARIISLPHFVASHEFSLTPLALRPRSWSVPGARYARRAEAVAALRAAELKLKTRSPLALLEALQRRGLLRNGSTVVQRVVNTLYWRDLERTQCVFTCGSGLRMPVRKFFEIPAAGAVLVCQPCNGFEALGFADGVNSIIAEPYDLGDLHRALERDPEKAQSIAHSGRQMVWTHHSVAARAQQLRHAVDAIRAGNFNGSIWRDGVFHLRPAATQIASK